MSVDYVFTQEYHIDERIPNTLLGQIIIMDVTLFDDHVYTYVALKRSFYDYELNALRTRETDETRTDCRYIRLIASLMRSTCWTLVQPGKLQDAYRAAALFVTKKTLSLYKEK